MKQAVYWFRNDLRLSDNAALLHACQQADQLTLVYCLAPEENTQWGFARVGQHRKAFLADTLADLTAQCRLLGSRLLIVAGEPSVVLPAILQRLKAKTVYCEAIAAPYEMAQVAALGAQGYCIETIWQSSLLDPVALPFQPQDLPLIFTTFRQQIEQSGTLPPAPRAFIEKLPATPMAAQELHGVVLSDWAGTPSVDDRNAFPYHQPQWHGGAYAALAHLQRYLALVDILKTFFW